MASLTEQLDALIAKHDLSSITITRIARESGDGFWSINAQAETASGQRFIGGANYQIVDVAEALAAAITELNAARAVPVVVEDLVPMQVAA